MSRVRVVLSVALASVVASDASLAQDAPAAPETKVALVGQVRDALAGSPVPHATVAAGDVASWSDAGGRFELALAPGSWTLRVSAEGYVPWSSAIEVGGDDGSLDVLLAPAARFHEEVVVSTAAPSVAPSRRPVEAEEVAGIAGAAEDVFRALQTLPGAAPANELQGRLAVRGGSPDENLTLLDGVELHNPYRLQGIVGAFHPATVARYELQAGSPDPRHGDRLSSSLIVVTRDGTPSERLAGSAALSLSDASLLLEGRLPGSSDAAWLVAARRTYYDLIAARFVDGALPSFGDVYAKLSWRPAAGRRLSLLALRGGESTDLLFGNDPAGFEDRLVGSASHALAAATLFAELGQDGWARSVVSWYRTADDLDLVGDLDDPARRSAGGALVARTLDLSFARRVRIRDLAFRQQLGRRVSPRHLLELGAELHRLATRWSWSLPGGRNEYLPNGSSMWGGSGLPSSYDVAQGATRFGAYLIGLFTPAGPWVVEPSLRLDHGGLNGRTVLLPRLAASRRLSATSRLRASIGRQAQGPGYEKTLHADYFVQLDERTAAALEHERSWQAALGLERDLSPQWSLSGEAYYRRLDRLVVGRLETDVERGARVARYDFPGALRDQVPTAPLITTWPVNGGRGSAYGVEALLRRSRRAGARLRGWISYTYGVARREAYGRVFPHDYDRRHTLALAGTTRLGRRFEVSLSGRVASGIPRTPPVGPRVAAVPDAADRDRDRDREELVPERDAEGRLVYTVDRGGVLNLNGARLPPYARLDARLGYRPSQTGRFWLYLDVINVLGIDNPGFLESTLGPGAAGEPPRVVEMPRGSLPRLPSLGVHVSF
jgi:hypothetical protein